MKATAMLLVIAWLSAIPGHAQVAVFDHPLHVPERFSDARFQQTRRLVALQRPLVSSGSVTLTASGFSWRQTEPFQVTLSYEGGVMTEAVIVDGQAVVRELSDPISNQLAQVLTRAMMGSWTELHTEFDLHVAGSVDEQPWTIELVPRERAVAQVIARIVVGASRYVDSISVELSNGDATFIVLSDHQANP